MDITLVCGSEYYHQWRVKRPRTKGLLNKVLKIMKIAGDFFGRGEMLVVIAKKNKILMQNI